MPTHKWTPASLTRDVSSLHSLHPKPTIEALGDAKCLIGFDSRTVHLSWPGAVVPTLGARRCHHPMTMDEFVDNMRDDSFIAFQRPANHLELAHFIREDVVGSREDSAIKHFHNPKETVRIVALCLEGVNTLDEDIYPVVSISPEERYCYGFSSPGPDGKWPAGTVFLFAYGVRS